MNTEYAMSAGSAPGGVPAYAADAPTVSRVMRRLRALVLLVRRRLRAARRRHQLEQLDDAALRDIGLTRGEISSVVSELGGRVAATRRRTDLDVWASASSRFRARAVDSFL